MDVIVYLFETVFNHIQWIVPNAVSNTCWCANTPSKYRLYGGQFRYHLGLV